MSERYRGVDETLAFTLPASGGFSVNGRSIRRNQIGALLGQFFATRPPAARSVVVWRAPASRCADVAFIASKARAAGGAAFDADRSGWLRPRPPDSLPAVR